jgi:hypothetical protein
MMATWPKQFTGAGHAGAGLENLSHVAIAVNAAKCILENAGDTPLCLPSHG